ncbi:MAG: hypothetical protein ACOH10_07775 [Rhodoglobus sp.]
MTAVTPEPTPPTLPPPSDLMAIVFAYKNGEVDWPTTKAALVDFTYVPDGPKKPEYGTPEYAEWYSRDDGLVASKANTLGELTEAAYTNKLEYDRFEEVAEALWAKYPKDKAAPAAKP